MDGEYYLAKIRDELKITAYRGMRVKTTQGFGTIIGGKPGHIIVQLEKRIGSRNKRIDCDPATVEYYQADGVIKTYVDGRMNVRFEDSFYELSLPVQYGYNAYLKI